MTREPRPPAAAAHLVSVVIPVWNAERYVGEALDSVLAQPYRDLEVIVVDDGSTDRSMAIVDAARDVRCRVLRQARLGAAAARNTGVSASSGRWLAFLDADDAWMPGKLAIQLEAVDRDPSLDLVFGHYLAVRDGDRATCPLPPAPGYSLGTLLVRKDRFLTVGPFSTEWRVGEFIDWFARAEDAGLRHAMLPDVLLRRRVHDANRTASHERRADYARVVRALAARRSLARPRGSSDGGAAPV